ncbi:hypothetical protein, partial [Metamycoplasma equirhinis]|uniref:hypothetical protein n=1 Tax=Metamycoplasma equirhinis TaxID=92402 RepID=UPI003593C41D
MPRYSKSIPSSNLSRLSKNSEVNFLTCVVLSVSILFNLINMSANLFATSSNRTLSFFSKPIVVFYNSFNSDFVSFSNW